MPEENDDAIYASYFPTEKSDGDAALAADEGDAETVSRGPYTAESEPFADADEAERAFRSAYPDDGPGGLRKSDRVIEEPGSVSVIGAHQAETDEAPLADDELFAYYPEMRPR